MLDFLKMLLTPEFFFSIIRISAPILFATLAAIVVEKAGFCNIGLEGLMMFSALTGSLVSYYAHSWVWGLLAALAIGVLMSLMMGFFAFQLKTDITLVSASEASPRKFRHIRHTLPPASCYPEIGRAHV